MALIDELAVATAAFASSSAMTRPFGGNRELAALITTWLQLHEELWDAVALRAVRRPRMRARLRCDRQLAVRARRLACVTVAIAAPAYSKAHREWQLRG